MSVPAGVSTHVQVLQSQVNQLTERLTKLEKSHQEGQEAIGGFASRLVQESANLDERILGLKAETGAALQTVEETFKKCDLIMEELKAASRTSELKNGR